MPSTVGERIRILRLEQNMTQEELGKMLGITKAAVQKYENGIIRNFKSDTIKKLCEIFQRPPVYFIYDQIPDVATSDGIELLIKHFGKWLISFMENMDSLNREGRLKVIDYCNDLKEIEKYKKQKEEPS